LDHLSIDWNCSRSLSARDNTLFHPLLEVGVDLRNGVMIKILHPAIVHLELLLHAFVAQILELAETVTGCAFLGLGIDGEWFVSVDEVLGTWVLIYDLVGVHANTESEILVEENRLGLGAAVFRLGVGGWEIASENNFVEATAGNTFSGFNADEGGDVILPSLLLLHVVKVKGGLISCDPLNGCLILLGIL
jgi:hypothetical protein